MTRRRRPRVGAAAVRVELDAAGKSQLTVITGGQQTGRCLGCGTRLHRLLIQDGETYHPECKPEWMP